MRKREERNLLADAKLDEYYEVRDVHERLAKIYFDSVVAAAGRQQWITDQMAIDYSIGNLRMLLDDLACCGRGSDFSLTVPLLWLWEETDKKWLGQNEPVYWGPQTEHVSAEELFWLFGIAVKAIREEKRAVADLIVVLTLAARELIDHFVEEHDIPYKALFTELEVDWATVGHNQQVTEGRIHRDFEKERFFYPYGDEDRRSTFVEKLASK